MRGAFAKGVASTIVAAMFVANVANAQPKPAQPKPATPPKPPAAAAAQPNLNEAKKHYGEGEKKYKAGDYQAALTEFQAADAIKATPQTARYIGLCLDGMGKYQDAVASYEKFLADVPKNMTAQGDEVKARVAAIKAMPGKVHLETTPPGANVTIDGKPHMTPTPTDVELPPGKHMIKFMAEGREPQEKEIEVAYASKQDVSAQLEAKAPPPPPPVAVVPPAQPTTAPPPPPPPPPEPRSKVPAYVTGGLAVVALGVGTVFGVMALGDKSDFDKNPTKDKADDGDNHALIADMAFAAALTLGITSAVLFLTKDEPPPATARAVPAPKRLVLTPVVTPTGGGAGALFRF